MKCRDKKAYQGKQEADRALREIKTAANYKEKDRKEERAYKCDACDLWHLTSMNTKFFNEVLEMKRSKTAAMINREVEYWTRKNKWSNE